MLGEDVTIRDELYINGGRILPHKEIGMFSTFFFGQFYLPYMAICSILLPSDYCQTLGNHSHICQ